MKHYGDITKIHGADVPVVDIITGGSPCQDLSVAGKRAGLAGERSGLFMEQMRIVKEMREHDRTTGRTGSLVRPRFLVWENVPGALSSPGGDRKGQDFAAVIEEIIKVCEPGSNVHVCVPDRGWTKSGCYYAEDGSWSIAWRVHDAQFWGATQYVDGRVSALGTPQRRKRIALVADFGGLSAPEILFERKGLSGNLEPCGEAGQETARAAGGGVEGAIGFNRERCGAVTMKDAMPTLQAAAGESGNNQPMAITFEGSSGAASYTIKVRGGVERDSYGKRAGKGPLISKELSATLGVSQDQTLIQQGGANSKTDMDSVSVYSFDQGAHRYAGCTFKNVAKTLTPGTSPGSHDAVAICCDVGMLQATKDVAPPQLSRQYKDPPIVSAYGIDNAITWGADSTAGGPCIYKEREGTLKACGPHAVAYGICSYDSNTMKSKNPQTGFYKADTSRTLDLNGGSPACNQGGIAVVQSVWNGKADGASGNGVAFATVGDHENRPTDMTNLVIGTY